MSTVEYFWAEPDAEIVEQKLLSLANELDDLSAPLAAAAVISQEDMQERFKTATDPSDRPWDPWAVSYEPFALTHSTGRVHSDRANLHLTGELERNATSSKSFVVTGNELFLDTSDWPEWWAWNNFGAERSTTTEAEQKKQARSIVLSAFKAGRRVSAKQALAEVQGGNTLPERPFVGLSSAAREKIDAAFAAWFADEVAVAVSSKGKTFFRHTKRVGGKFAPRA